MRFLITGGCGFLGHHVVEHLLKNTGAEIVVVDKLSYAANGFNRLREIEALFHGRVRVLTADVSVELSEGLAKEIDFSRVDYVIHTAAETHVDNSIADPLPFVTANVLGTHHVLGWLRRKESAVKRLFLVSTDEVYGPAPEGVEYKVEDRFRPTNPYAATKAGAECLAMSYAHTYSLPVTIVNAMNFVGERQDIEKYVPKVIRAVLAGDEVLIHADPTKTRAGTRFYLHCRSFADALLFLIAREFDECKIHVAGDREVSNLELAQLIAGAIGKPLKYRLVDFHSTRPGHDLRYALDDALIRAMGWRPPITFDAALDKMVRWYVDHPEWLATKR